ncbi:MAG TPA: molybdopterin cofactor-binding domain-containing protein [Candidatus Binatia bacterium]|nr:molybdopterin cofactor-binding domain-containing protein [Candidatus Binatia bacterium]
MNTLARGDFMKISGALGAGLVLGVRLPSQAAADIFRPSAFVQVHPDGTVSIFLNKSEMGQGVMTGFSTLLADELDVAFSRVRVEFALADPMYNDPVSHGMSTGGSTSTPHMWIPMRTAGATARAMLVSAAAQQWGVDPATCVTSEGTVRHAASGRSASYGSLVRAASALPVPQNVALKTPDKFALIGKQQARIDVPLRVNGRAKYGMDVRLPGMLYAAVAKPPVFGSKLRRFDATKAKTMKGVRDVFPISSGVAVVAGDTWTAQQAKYALSTEWDEGPVAQLSTAGLFAEAEELAKSTGIVAKNVGNVDAAQGTAIAAVYRGPFLAHAAMEPMNATAWVRDGRCEVWAPTQVQLLSRTTASKASGLPVEQCVIHTTFLGGGFGRRLQADYVADAVEVAKKVGVPVKVVWSREDDIQHDFYRPMSLNAVRGVLDSGGKLVALSHKVVSPSIARYRNPQLPATTVDNSAVNGVANIVYDLPNFRAAYVAQDHGIPVGPWRAPGANWNTFVTESFIDELAQAAKRDPIEFRLALLGKSPRAAAVLKLVADKVWGKPLPGTHQGVAFAFWNGSYGALVADVAMEANKPRIKRAAMAVDCGLVINPKIVVAQTESAINYGLAAALTGKITLRNGRVEQNNFNDYTVLRMPDAPRIDIFVVPSQVDPTGIGELGTPPIAPAVANAIFAATGKRVRSLPLNEALA